MSLQDRVYYRERHRALTTARRREATSSLRIAILWIALGACLFVAFRWAAGERRSAPPVVRSTPIDAPIDAPPGLPHSSPAAPTRAGPSASAPSPASSPVAPVGGPIHRCGNSYGHEPCAGGRAVAAPAASGFDSRPSERLARLVSDGRAVESGTTVTRTTTIVDGFVVSESSDAQPNRSACPTLAADIERIDRAARLPQSMPQQDALRRERQGVRDRQARLHC